MSLSLDTSLSRLSGIGPRFLKHLHTLGLETVQDILWHFPARYEDLSRLTPIGELTAGQHATIRAVIKNVSVTHSWRRRMSIVTAELTDETGNIRAVWFNQPYLKNILLPGRTANFSGKTVSSLKNGPTLQHPEYEVLSEAALNQKKQLTTGSSFLSSLTPTASLKHTGRLVPVYPETRGLTSRGLRFIIWPILQNVENVPEFLPHSVLKTYRLPEINPALYDIHFPETVQAAEAARRRFAFEDLFLLQLYNLQHKISASRQAAAAIPADTESIKKKILPALPFVLTVSQKKSLWEILQDMAKPHPMNRLLQGDVGSGKTVVAFLAALQAAQGGYQSVFLAPTEILARQHFETARKLLVRLFPETDTPPVAFLTGSEARLFYGEKLESQCAKKDVLEKIGSGEAQLVIGTHALIQKSVDFQNPGLVIIDEQHRFGVRQRQTLLREAVNYAPHLLSMSATPIPRTLMLTVFGDLDISLITELPTGRKNIITKVVAPENRAKAYQFVREKVRSGRQVFVICPRIDPPRTDTDNARTNAAGYLAYPRRSALPPRGSAALTEVKTVKQEYEKLSKEIFPDLRVAMLHGKMQAKEKKEVMRKFQEARVDILVSTSVVEVGVDIPNAVIMLIEGADRFGLAQLYQFRGRVGRGKHQSYCLLFTDSPAVATQKRLALMARAKNGLALAEYDLNSRGPGEFLGERQTGLPDIAMASLRDIKLVAATRKAAREILAASPDLAAYPALQEKLARFRQRVHLE